MLVAAGIAIGLVLGAALLLVVMQVLGRSSLGEAAVLYGAPSGSPTASSAPDRPPPRNSPNRPESPAKSFTVSNATPTALPSQSVFTSPTTTPRHRSGPDRPSP